jgi:hypothetical protein
MANTVIQLKWSDVTSAPTTLNVGEAAYSNTSQRLYIGDTSNNVLTIGGKFFVDQQGQIFTKTNVAFDTANSAASYANSAFASSNNNAGAATAGSYANSAFGVANSAASYANSGFAVSNSAASYANSAFLSANNIAGVNLTQNTNITNASTYANSAFAAANTADAKGTSAGSYANSAFLTANTPSSTANSAAAYANGAFAAANTKLSSSGGTITGNLDITGNLTVSGNTTFVNTEILSVEDSLIKLANNNTAGDTLDIGFYGMYKPTTGAVNYTGLARTAGANTYFLFRGLTNDPTTNALASGSVTAANTALLVANVQSYAISINGIDVETNEARIFTQANSAFAAANTADAKGTSAGSYANSAFLTANTPSHVANSAASYANSAFAVANNGVGIDATQNTNITSAASYANSAFVSANSAGSYANSAFLVANTPSHVANSAASYANSAFAKANTDFTNISTTAADHGTASSVSAFRLEANGRISSANSTAIAIAASAITSGTLGVARGGTGAGTFTTNGVLLGQGTSAFTTASSSTEGHLLTINASGVPTFSHLQGGTF